MTKRMTLKFTRWLNAKPMTSLASGNHVMRRAVPLMANVIFIIAAYAQNPAQTAPPPLGTLSGKVLDETGKPVQGNVVAAAKGQTLRIDTSADGSFRFANLRTGTYLLCVHPSAADRKTTDRPLVDSCAWQDPTSQVIRLAPGENRADVTVPAPHGYVLTVRVNDPARRLAPTVAGRLGGSEMSVTVAGPAGVPLPVAVARQDGTGRDYDIVLAYDKRHTVLASSAAFELADAGGAKLSAGQTADVSVRGGGADTLVVFSVGAAKGRP